MPALPQLASIFDSTASDCLGLTVLVLDQQPAARLAVADIIKSIDINIAVRMFSRSGDALLHLRHEPADLVLVDYRMPVLNGLETIRQLRSMYSKEALPIMLTADLGDRAILPQAFEAGATDFITRPFDPVECLARCRNLLGFRRQYLAAQGRASLLQERVEQVSRDLRVREMDTLFRLAGAADCRDAVTGAHLKRMAKYSALIARGIGLDEHQIEEIELAAPMHDIGKIGIPDAIMQKRGQLNADEIVIMQTHTRIGYDILKDSPSRFLQAAAMIALHHHEKFDGSGYPSGLRGMDIPLQARVVALADVFDALTSTRPYKTAWEWGRAVDYIKAQKSTHFDPELVDVFVENIDAAREIQQTLMDACDAGSVNIAG